MINRFCKTNLWECARTLVDVAQGRRPADTVIRNARLVNVCTGELQEHTDIAVACGRIALVGDAAHCVGEGTKVIDAEGQYVAPGFLDGHIHVESSMLSVGEYARAVVPHGTVGIFWDNHEVANVLGAPGVRLMIEDSKRTPLKAMVTAPSCVPAVGTYFEDNGAQIGPEEIREMMTWDHVVALGEMMNFPGVLGCDPDVHAELAETLKADKVITGHYSVPETGAGLNAYLASGIRCCHESTRKEDALEKMRRGCYAQLREGSAWRDLHEVVKAITETKVDSRFAMLISDDTHPNTLASVGHIDHLVRRGIEEGLDPVTAIQMVTINPAQCFRMDNELGSVTPGKCADLVFLSDLVKVSVTRTMIDGDVVAENGEMLAEIAPFQYPDWATHTVNVGKKLSAADFVVKAPEGCGETAKLRAIEIIPAKVGDIERIVEMKVENGAVASDLQNDLLKTFVFERHHATGRFSFGFVKGLGITRGAIAQTVAHDAHNLLVTGTDDADMALAANTLAECGGGMCAVADGKILGLVPLPIAGLMSDRPAEEVAAMVARQEQVWEEMGCGIVSPFMTLALIPLACLPDLRLTDKGLVDCRTFRFVDLFVEE
ncbi:MAG TPA: adenine deaminase [Oscillospiraceae bacterium]|nr:adenine deaminase [Oscillospiraceae bacterium]HNW04425.1 adenine deaminase [Oscillospiraceae bacterium]